jgi:hypothetical protein
MTVQTNTDHYEVARNLFSEADDLSRNLGDPLAIAAAQVQATMGVGHALLDIAQLLNSIAETLSEGLNVYSNH